MQAALLGAITFALALLQYPAPPPQAPTPTPVPPAARYSPKPQPKGLESAPTPAPQRVPGRPAQAPTGALNGPLAQLSWLLGHWTCAKGAKLYFSSSEAGAALIEQLDSPTVRSAGRLTEQGGRWYFSGSAATTEHNTPFELSGDIVDVGATYIDLKGQLYTPGASIPTRFVRHKTSATSFTDTASLYVGGNWIAAPSRSCKRG